MPITGTGSTLSALIQSKMTSNGIYISEAGELTKLTKAIADAVIEHFVSNAVIAVTGVTPGGGSASGTVS